LLPPFLISNELGSTLYFAITVITYFIVTQRRDIQKEKYLSWTWHIIPLVITLAIILLMLKDVFEASYKALYPQAP